VSFPAASLFTEPFISFHLIKIITNKPGNLAEAGCILHAVTEDRLLSASKAIALAQSQFTRDAGRKGRTSKRHGFRLPDTSLKQPDHNIHFRSQASSSPSRVHPRKELAEEGTEEYSTHGPRPHTSGQPSNFTPTTRATILNFTAGVTYPASIGLTLHQLSKPRPLGQMVSHGPIILFLNISQNLSLLLKG